MLLFTGINLLWACICALNISRVLSRWDIGTLKVRYILYHLPCRRDGVIYILYNIQWKLFTLKILNNNLRICTYIASWILRANMRNKVLFMEDYSHIRNVLNYVKISKWQTMGLDRTKTVEVSYVNEITRFTWYGYHQIDQIRYSRCRTCSTSYMQSYR